MNVGELRAKMADAPDDAEVIVTSEGDPSVGIFGWTSEVYKAALVPGDSWPDERRPVARVFEIVVES